VVVYILKWLEFIILIVLNPTFALIGLLFNLLVLNVISHLRKHNQKSKDFNASKNMFRHININAGFNVIYCLIMMFKLLNECLFYSSSLYCSKAAQLVSVQWLKIVLIELFGNAIKICCNISYIGIGLSRFILISSKNKGIISKFYSLRTSIYATVLILFGVLLSLFKLFEYKINLLHFSFNSFDFPYERRGYFNL
jgi:hypothetical protein